MPQTEVFFYRDEDGPPHDQTPERFRATIAIPEDAQDL